MEVTPEVDEDGNAYIKMENFKDILDIDKVKYYTIQDLDGALAIRFFDEDKKEILPNKEN